MESQQKANDSDDLRERVGEQRTRALAVLGPISAKLVRDQGGAPLGVALGHLALGADCAYHDELTEEQFMGLAQSAFRHIVKHHQGNVNGSKP